MTLYRETPCEHGYSVAHCLCDYRTVECPGWCPGGSREEVTIDYEAAARLGVVWASLTEKEQVTRIAYVKPFIDTALTTEKEPASA